MRNNVKRKGIIIALIVCLFASLAGFSFAKTNQKALATEAAWQTGIFEMEDGVSLKLSNSNGLRFIVKMDESVASFVKNNESAELGFIIAPQEFMENANGDYLNMTKKIRVVVDKNKIYQEGEFYLANGCVTQIREANREFKYVAIAYVSYGEDVRYTEYNSLARNSLYSTLNSTFLGGYSEVLEYDCYSSWYGTAEYPIAVDTVTEYNSIAELVENRGVDLSGKILTVEGGISPSNGGFTSATVARQPIVIDSKINYVTNVLTGLPYSLTMPDAVGTVATIRNAERLYNSLSDNEKNKLDAGLVNKLNTLVASVKGYDRVYKNDSTDSTVIPSYIPGGYSSQIGGSAMIRQDAVYGNVLRVTSNEGGRAALSYLNFPDVSSYEKVYFYVRIIGTSCDIYLSDGISNDGWGDNWRNTWSTSGFWCNSGTWRLIEVNLSDGDASNDYIGANFALGFRTTSTGITFEISDFFGYTSSVPTESDLNFGVKTDSGEVNEYGKVYNISREQWYIDNNNVNTIGTLQQNKLANALPSGFEHFYFWMYNGTGMEYNFHLAGDVSGAWTDSADTTPLKVGEWTKIVISSEDINLNKNGQWYVYLLGGDGQGAAKSGWKISPIYVGPYQEYQYVDYADVKDVVSMISEIPSTPTLKDEALIVSARQAYDALSAEQQSLVSNVARLRSAENAIKNHKLASEVIALIDAINPRDIDETLVVEAREAYSKLPGAARKLVTNIALLVEYEAEISANKELESKVSALNETIANLPDSVVMPDHLVFVSRIEKARDDYNNLSDEGKERIENYDKLRSLIGMIKGYGTVHRQTVESVNVIPSYVPGGYSSTIGGSASLGYDGYYGNYLKVTSSSGGRASIQYIDFPDVSMYSKIYFNIRVVGASCDIYLSDGITNDGWGEGWNNTWSMSGLWANNGNWIQKEIATSTGIFTANWALGLRTSTNGVSFEITDIVGWAPELGTNSGLTFGNFTATNETNAYGTVYNFTQGWSSDSDMGAFNQNALSNALAAGHDTLHFWIYNPNGSSVNFSLSGDMNNWTPEGDYVTTLPAGVWTEVVITPEQVELGKNGTWFVGVTSGAGTSGWKISALYSYNSQVTSDDSVSSVQNRINALDVNNIYEENVKIARGEFETLNEAEKALINTEKLIACETALYGDVATAQFITNGQTQYKIYYEVSYKEYAVFMQEQLMQATGATISLVSANPKNLSKYSYAIIIGYEALAAELGVTVPENGYTVKRVGRVVCIVANRRDNYRMGVLAFLREVVGYEMIAEDCITYNGDGGYLPQLALTEVPSFEYRQQQTYMTDDEILGMGLQSHADIWIPSNEGWDMHNALHYLPVSTYASSHPNWFTSDKTQICPTAGGTASEFNAMVDVIVANMMVQINAKPALENISLSIMDSAGDDACTCARCTLYNTLYGNAGFSAAWIDLINAVNAKIQAQVEGRTIYVSFLAYRSTESAPANDNYTLKQRYVINDNGSYSLQTDGRGNPVYLKCDDKVVVWLAPINALYAENFNHVDNAEHLDTVKKWCAISDRVYVWLYGTNFKNYMYPYNSWQASAENYKILKDLGVDAVWSQSNETEATAFTDLKAYIDSKFMFDVNANYEEVLDNYFDNYFGPASEKMRSMFDSIVAKCEEIEANNSGLGRGIYDNIENTSGFIGIGAKTYWSKDWINSLVTLCDEAKAIVNASSLSEEEKAAIISRITKESLFPRYVLCTTFASSYSSSNKKTLRQGFKADADALGFEYYREANGLLSSLYSEWKI